MQETTEDLKAEQRVAQRLLGRCILRLQLYECLLKGILSDHAWAGSVSDLAAIRADQERRTARKTLGTLVGEFLGSYLIAGEPHDRSETSDGPGVGTATVSFRVQVSLSPDELEQTSTDLKELVELRNMLVHTFIDQHDLWSVEGCRRAQEALVEAHDRIDSRLLWLAEIAKCHDATMAEFAELMRSEALRSCLVAGED
jgi:hypothetical protein